MMFRPTHSTQSPPTLRSTWTRLVLAGGLHLAMGAAALAGEPPSSPPADSATAGERHALELLMASQRMDKRQLLKEALDLTRAQGDRFWPLYYEYQARLIPIYDRKFALIERYAKAYPDLSERQADRLVRESLAAKKEQLELLERYYGRMAAAVSRNVAARFVQMESAWNGAFDVKLLSRLPLIPKSGR